MSLKQQYQTRREQASNIRRSQVLATAGECFAESGYRGTPVELIAKRAGVSKGLVFTFFISKEALFEAVVKDSLAKWAKISEAGAASRHYTAAQELRQLFLTSFGFIENHPIMQLFLRQDEEMLFSYRRPIARQNRLWRRRLGETLLRGVKVGEFRDDIDVERTALIFHEVQVALLLGGIADRTPKKPDTATVELAIDLLLRSVCKNPV